MAQPYIGEIRMFAGNFAPAGWMFCHGQLLAIADNETLFTLIGTTYGGDGQSTFALPNLAGRFPLHFGQGPGLASRFMAESGGTPAVTLTALHLPAHSHVGVAAASPGHLAEAVNAVPAAHRDFAAFSSAPATPMRADSIQPAGGGQPHDNMPPHLSVHFIISLFGIYPSFF